MNPEATEPEEEAQKDALTDVDASNAPEVIAPVSPEARPIATERSAVAISEPEQVLASGEEAEALMARLSRRAFLQAGIVTAGIVGGIYAFNKYAPVETTAIGNGIKTTLREGHERNESIATALFSENRAAPEFPRERAVTPRNNYHGETPTPDLSAWKLTVEGLPEGSRTLTLADLKALNFPEISATTELKCVEGWSAIVNWSGWRLRDFMEKFPPPPGTNYVAMRSEPEGFEESWYYVGLDLPACRHPQTLLATGMNGVQLNADHGAPLRLVIPHKYGIKNIKLITHIAYAPQKPRDYWAERGYDYYAGL
jgi:DMSO/TMAO reductase YedYZ molybdopterin-dependent catalytic subunit